MKERERVLRGIWKKNLYCEMGNKRMGKKDRAEEKEMEEKRREIGYNTKVREKRR